VYSRFGTGAEAFCNKRGQGLWVPAFAGTTNEFLRGLRITFVNAMFTTFMRVRFTNVFDVILQNPARPCVWRGRIAD
jgi:hypothetical protein